MNWFNKIVSGFSSSIETSRNSGVPKGLWRKCDGCGAALYTADLNNKCYVCPQCNYHLYISAETRLDLFLDKKGRTRLAENVRPNDWLKFKDLKRYQDRLNNAKDKTKNFDAAIAYYGMVKKEPIIAISFDFEFMGGSMGSAVGEIFQVAADFAIDNKLPLICFSTSGGARMQEGLVSLFQMGKTSAAIARLKKQSLPFISVLTNPTYGGVSASLAMLGDINIAEPKAEIGFAGPRVIEQTVRETLPEGFQTSEFLLEHGAIDMIVSRQDLPQTIADLVSMLNNVEEPKKLLGSPEKE